MNRGDSEKYKDELPVTARFDLCDANGRMLDEGMRFLAAALLLVLGVACEKKPSPQEVEQQQQRAAEAAKRSPSPTPGGWMWKGYQNPLDKKPK